MDYKKLLVAYIRVVGIAESEFRVGRINDLTQEWLKLTDEEVKELWKIVKELARRG